MERTSELYGARIERIDHLKFAHYQSEPGVTKALLDQLNLSPAHAHEAITGADGETVEMLVENVVESFFTGQPFHGCWIRPETYPDRNGAKKPWNGHANWCRDWLKAHGDKPVLTTAEYNTLQGMARATFMHRHFRAITTPHGASQVSLFGTHLRTGLQLKVRLDRLEKSGIVELKRVANASTDAARQMVASLRCHVQAALQRELCRQNGIEAPAHWLVFVERGGRPRVNVRRLEERAIELGRTVLERELNRLHECVQRNSWPDYSGDTNEPGTLGLPPVEYARNPEARGTTAEGGRPGRSNVREPEDARKLAAQPEYPSSPPLFHPMEERINPHV